MNTGDIEEVELGDIEPMTDFAREYPKLGTYETWRYRVKNRHANGLEESGALTKKDDRWWIIKSRLKSWWLKSAA